MLNQELHEAVKMKTECYESLDKILDNARAVLTIHVARSHALKSN